MKKTLVVVMLVIAAVACTQTLAFAASPWTTQTTYMEKTGHKLGFGLKNALLGWTELITKPVDYHTEGKNVFEGFGAGVVHALVYTAGGVLHVATFPIPIDVPLPNDGVTIG